MQAIGHDVTSTTHHRVRLREWISDHLEQLAEFGGLRADMDGQFERLRRYQRLLYDEGWLRYGWPEAFGGLGGSVALRSVTAEELTAAGYPPSISFGMMEVLAPAVVQFAAPIATWALPPLLAGDEIWCQGFSEPEAGSDLGSLRLTATDAGDHWRVTGQKIWTSFAQYAHRCFLLARTGTRDERHRGITALFVDMDSPGITVRPLQAMTGNAEFAEVFFDDVPVAKERVIGAIGGGWSVAMYVLSCERGTVAWQRQAWMHRRLADLLPDLHPGRDGAANWAGQSFAALYALRLASRRTVRRLDAGEIAGFDASIDKILMSRAEQLLFDGALEQHRAAVLFGDEPADERWRAEYLFSRAASIYGGTAEIQRNIVAENLLGLPRDG